MTLTDLDSMPWGKHKGKPMMDIPVDYFHWLWLNGKHNDPSCPVADYIRRNLGALQIENPDNIW